MSNQEMNINKRKIEEINKKGKKASLKRIAVMGLFAAGLGTAILATKLNNDLENPAPIEKVFEFDQNDLINPSENSNVNNNIDDNLLDSYVAQYKEETGYEITDKATIEALSEYDISYDNYQTEYNNNKDSKATVKSRINLVESTKKLTNIADGVMIDKIKQALNITDKDIKVSINRVGGSGNEEIVDVINVTKNGQTLYQFESDQVPKEMSDLLTNINGINIYQGNGENDAWDNEMNKYNNKGIDLYNNILGMIDNEYEVNDSKLVNINTETKTR